MAPARGAGRRARAVPPVPCRRAALLAGPSCVEEVYLLLSPYSVKSRAECADACLLFVYGLSMVLDASRPVLSLTALYSCPPCQPNR